MAKRNATGSRSSLLAEKLDDRPDNPLDRTVKRRRMCFTPSYKSPLAHFRKSNLRSLAKPIISDDLDDSIVLVKEVTGLPLLHNFTLSTGPKKCTANPDESVIILSDNEENLVEKETDVQLLNIQAAVEDSLSGENSEPAAVGRVRRKIQPRVKPKTITSGVTLPKTKSSMSELSSESNTVGQQSISIDSEDENTSPNEDLSRSHPQAEIIIIDNSLIDKSNDVSMPTISSPFSPGNYSHAATTQDDISVIHKPRKELQTAADQSAAPSLGKTNDKCGTCPTFCIDTKGDPSLAFSILKGPSAGRRRVKGKESLRNTNWSKFGNNKSSRRLPIENLNIANRQARVDESDNCRIAETTASNGPLGSMDNKQSTVVRNDTRVDGIGSCLGKNTSATNGTTEGLHLHKMNVASSQSEANVTGSNGKTAVTDESSETLPPKKMKSRKIKAQHNAIGSYYSKQTIVNTPGSLREIIIDGCNIATQYTKGQYFSEEGLKLVIDYFKLRGHTVKAFVPQHVRSIKNVVLEKLYTDGVVVFTPSRLIGGKRISSYDDRYILDYAAMNDGIVVSQDQYRDLYTEKLEWRRVIEERLLVPTFVGKCVMFPEDPLGRHGPTLDRFLRH